MVAVMSNKIEEGRYPTEYPREMEELTEHLKTYALAYRDGEEDSEVGEIRTWLDETVNRHRAQATSIAGLEAIKVRAGWWERNWFGLVLVGIWVVGMLVIGLTNGWS
jgi:hypothetical protein